MSSSMKIKKKRKSLDDEGIFTLDNSAPVKDILDATFTRNPTAHLLYCRTLGRRAAHCCLVGHALAAFPDHWDGELSPRYHETLAYRATAPRPLGAPLHAGAQDPVAGLLASKAEWADALKTMTGAAQSSKELGEYRRVTAHVARCPRHYVNVAARLQSEPAPFLRSHFNWLYAGRGNLHTVHWQHSYRLHSHLTTFYITRLKEDGTTYEPSDSSSFDCGHDVLETTCSQSLFVVALRTLHKVFLLQVTTRHKLCVRLIKTLSSETPHTSAEFDSQHESVLYVTKLDDTVDIMNLSTLTIAKVTLNKKPLSVDNWNAVVGFDRLHYVHATTRALTVYDKRTHNKLYTIDTHRKVCESCNDITAVRRSDDVPHSFYFATNHHVFCVDARCMRSRRHRLLTRWTHGMRCPPTLMCLRPFGSGREAVFLSSQWAEDVTVLVNDAAHLRAGLPPSRVALPLRLPSVTDSLSIARSRKLCLDPSLDVVRRSLTSLTGLSVVQRGETYEVLTQNSLGDIFTSTWFPEEHEQYMNDDSGGEWDAWSRQLCLPRAASLPASEVANVSRWWAYRSVAEGRAAATSRGVRPDRSLYTEEAVVQLFESEHFDKDLLDAWNIV